MKCTAVDLGGGVTAVFCGGRGRRQTCSVPQCGRDATKLCDFAVGPPGVKQRTCSAKLCDTHATKKGEADLCPAHANMRVTVQG